MEDQRVTLGNNMADLIKVDMTSNPVLGIATRSENMCSHRSVYASYS